MFRSITFLLHPVRATRSPAQPSPTLLRSLLTFLLPAALCYTAHAQVGAGNPMCHNAAVHVSSPTVRVGQSVKFYTTSDIGPITAGLWNVVGDWNSGHLYGQDGTFIAPDTVPTPNTTTVDFNFAYNACIPAASVTILNPAPRIDLTQPAVLTQPSTRILIGGAGFMPTSVLTVNGVVAPNAYYDSTHMIATVNLGTPANAPVVLAVTNPDPGSSSSTFSIPSGVTSSDPVCQNTAVHVSSPSVRVGQIVKFSTTSDSGPRADGVWNVVGDWSSGHMYGQDGTFIAPDAVPNPNTTTVAYNFAYNRCVPTASVTILNPAPRIDLTQPAVLTQPSTRILIGGAGFLPTSVLTVNGVVAPRAYYDSTHMVATVSLGTPVTAPVKLVVTNPDPGASSSTFSIPSGVTSSDPVCQHAAVHVSSPTVRVGSSVKFSTTSDIGPLNNGIWNVVGTWDSGHLFGQDGTFIAPDAVPTPNVTTVTYNFAYNACVPSTSVTILNITPRIDVTWPSSVDQLSTPVVVVGAGFMRTSVLTINGKVVPFGFVDQYHLTSNITLDKPVTGPVTIVVTNPDPGSTSSTISIPATFPGLNKITPTTLVGGPNTLTVTGSGFNAQSTLTFDGKPLSFNLVSDTTLTANVFIAPWRNGSIPISVQPIAGGPASASASIPIQTTTIPFDVAARFSTQAAFGPRPDIVQHIQQIGLQAFVTEQLQQPPVAYTRPGTFSTRSQFMRAAAYGNSLLRLRVATALGSFIVTPASNDDYASYFHWENLLENRSFGNFRDLLTDITADPNMGTFLNLAGSNASSDPNLHPNQNFARELMQLFTLGPSLLNDDGSLQLSATGHTIPTYDQNTLLDLSRALTGWNYPAPVDPVFTIQSADYSLPLIPRDDLHDHGAKTLFGSVHLPAGQDITSDRTQALDAIFNHPNLPPFLVHILIQRLVKSNPSPAYIKRIGAVFKDNGHGVRGDLSAVVSAILLDPEARAGDTTPAADDGFLQDPLMFQIFALSATQQGYSDNQPSFVPKEIGEDFWYFPSVTGFYAPTSLIPGTSIVSPEYSLWNNLSLVHRTEILYGLVSGTASEFGNDYMNHSWLFQNFTNVPDLVDALDHLLYHGTMPATTRSTILNYCATLGPANQRQQFISAIFLALNSDTFNVTH